MDHGAISNNRYLTTVAQYFTFADLEQFRFAIDRNANAIAARVAHRRRSGVLQHRKHHVAHLALVFGRHKDDVRDRSKIGDVEQPVVSLPVASGDAAPIETELYVKILNADVVYDLVETTLQKRRVDSANRLQTFTGHTGRKRYAVLLRNA